MTARQLLEAFGEIEETYIEAAAHQMQKRKKNRRARWGAAAAAAMLILTGAFGTAMAVNASFRQKVLSFFHISQAESVPEEGSEGAGISQSDIGGLVKAEYIRLEEGARYETGFGTLNQVDRAENGAIRSVRFWAIKDGAALSLDTQKKSFTAAWQGRTVQGTVFWCVSDGTISLYGNGPEGPDGFGWHASPVPGRTDQALLYLTQGNQAQYREYPLLYHLDTGETEDFLQGTGAEDLPTASDFQWSDDLSKAIIACRDGSKEGSAAYYYCDVAAKSLTCLQDAAGLSISAACFVDENTLLLFQEENGTYSVFTYDVAAGRAAQTVSQAKCLQPNDAGSNGMMFFGGRRALSIDPAGALSVVDLKTGEETLVQGFALQEGGDFLASPSNTKLLYFVKDGSKDSLGISQLGVLDLSAGTFAAFDREGYDSLYEWSVGWLDDSRAQIWGERHGAPVLYLYEF